MPFLFASSDFFTGDFSGLHRPAPGSGDWLPSCSLVSSSPFLSVPGDTSDDVFFDWLNFKVRNLFNFLLSSGRLVPFVPLSGIDIPLPELVDFDFYSQYQRGFKYFGINGNTWEYCPFRDDVRMVDLGFAEWRSVDLPGLYPPFCCSLADKFRLLWGEMWARFSPSFLANGVVPADGSFLAGVGFPPDTGFASWAAYFDTGLKYFWDFSFPLSPGGGVFPWPSDSPFRIVTGKQIGRAHV